MESNFFEIPLEHYRCRIFIAKNISDLDLLKALKKSDLPLEVREFLVEESQQDDDTDAWTIAEDSIVLIRFFEKEDNNLIAHELFHAVSHILRRAGIQLTDDPGTDEAWAYTMGYVFEKFYEKI